MHFEDLWNDAEKIGNEELLQPTIKNIADKIKAELDKFILMDKFSEQQARILGEIVFDLSRLSSKCNINSHAALKYAIEQHKAEMFDPSSDGDDI